MNLQFDENIALNLAGIPSCPSSELASKNIAQAWEQCGPGADGNPASEGNAYLSTGLGNNVSGIGSTIPNGGGAVACTMIFKGADNNHVTIYARAPANTTPGATTRRPTPEARRRCSSPAPSRISPRRSIYDWTLTVPNTQTADPALDDFYATLTRGTAFRAKCATRNPSAHRMLGTWDYTASRRCRTTTHGGACVPH